MSQLPKREENPDGLHQRYNVTRADGTYDPDAQYFVLRLDFGGDMEHAMACRAAARTYIAMAPPHMKQVAAELEAWASLKDDTATDSVQFKKLIDMISAWARLEHFNLSLNWLEGDATHPAGWAIGYAKEKKPVELDDDGYQKRYPTQTEAVMQAVRYIDKMRFSHGKVSDDPPQ
jgi:hypothetical protein